MTLASWLIAACLVWTHAARMTDAHCAELSEAIASTDADSREALDLVALAFWEGGLFDWVWDGSCNERDVRWQQKHHVGSCDSGFAYSAWQQHLGPFVPAYVPKPGGRTEHLSGWTLVNDKRFAAACALGLYRVSPANWSTWSRARALAASWRARHPPP